MKKFLLALALLLVFPAVHAQNRAIDSPVGAYYVYIPWEADFSGDGIPEEYGQTIIWVFNADGTTYSTDMDSNSASAGYWRVRDGRTVITKSLVFRQAYVPEFNDPRFVTGIGDGRLKFSRDFSRFKGNLSGIEWFCDPSPWGGYEWKDSCLNPITTDKEPDIVTLPSTEIVIRGWRLPEPE